MNDADEPSLRLRPNVLHSGDAATARIEWLPRELVGQRVKLELVEVDDQGLNPRPLTAFAVDVVAAPEGEEGLRFANAERQAAAGELKELPPPGEDGVAWAIPHLKLSLEGCEGEHVVVPTVADVRERRHAEGMRYELSLRLTDAAGVERYPAGKPVPFAELTCEVVLAENCARAAVHMFERHRRGIKERKLGHYYGQMSIYRGVYRADPPLADSHAKCHVCALRAQDEQDGRKPAANGAMEKHERVSTPLVETDCTAYVDQVIKLAFTKSRAAADALWYASKRRWYSGLEVGQVLQNLGWVLLYFSENGGADAVLEELARRKGFVKDVQSGTPAQRNDGVYPNAARIDATVVGFADETHPEHPTSREKFARLCELPFAVFLPGNQVHMLMGVQGKLYECHWGAGPRDPELFDDADTIEGHFGWSSFFVCMPQAYYLQMIEPAPPELEQDRLELPATPELLPESIDVEPSPNHDRILETSQRAGSGSP